MTGSAHGASQTPRVAVLTPFYNTAKYLRECIESVLAQSYQNFEYILVDNHSSDGSRAIAQEYVQRDARIRLLSPSTFLPQVQNYNFAIDQIDAASQYCKFVQADDWLYPQCIEQMVGLAQANPNVAVTSALCLRESQVGCAGLHPSRGVLSGRDACRLFLLDGVCLFGSPTTVLYSMDAVRSRRPFFEEGRLHEDTEVVFEVLADADFAFVHQILTFSRVHAESISGAASRFTPDAIDRYVLVKRYGQRVLSPSEYSNCLGHATRWIYGTMARQWVSERVGKARPDFWQYMREGLASVGEEIDTRRFALHVAAITAKGVLSPLEVLTGAAAQWKSR